MKEIRELKRNNALKKKKKRKKKQIIKLIRMNRTD